MTTCLTTCCLRAREVYAFARGRCCCCDGVMHGMSLYRYPPSNKKASSNNSSEAFPGLASFVSRLDPTTPQTLLAQSLSALGRRRRRFGLFRGLGSPIRVPVDHITHVFRGPHTGHAHTRSRKVTRGLSADRYCSRCRYCCARLVCAGRVLLPLHTCILLRRYHTLLHHHAVTTIAITYICRCLLDRSWGGAVPAVSHSVKSRG